MPFSTSPVVCVPSPDAATPQSLQAWQGLTRAALAAQAECRSSDALLGFHRALRMAEALFHGPLWPDAADDVLAAYVVSHHNLSDLLDALGRTAEAITHVRTPHLHLLSLDRPAQDPEIRRALWRHLGETRRQLILWRVQHAGHPDLAATLDAALAALPPGTVQH